MGNINDYICPRPLQIFIQCHLRVILVIRITSWIRLRTPLRFIYRYTAQVWKLVLLLQRILLHDTDTVNQLITDGVISNAVLLPSDLYELPNQVTIPSGQQSQAFRLSVDLVKLSRDYPDLAGKKLVVAVGLDETSDIELNKELSTTIIIIDSEHFMPLISMPQSSEDGFFIDSDSENHVFDDVAQTLDIKLGVSCSGILYKGSYSVDIITRPDIVNQWIADDVITRGVMLPSDVYTLPETYLFWMENQVQSSILQ
jgi:hypothetical protein